MQEKSEALYQIENKQFEKAFIMGAAVLLIVIGVIVSIYFFMSIGRSHEITTKNELVNLEDSAHVGDFISGVVGTMFSLAGVILLIWTLKDQRENFHKERLEGIFFEMVRFHRDNVNEITYTYHDPTLSSNPEHRVTAEKRKVFRLIFSDFKDAFNELKPLFESSSEMDIYCSEYLSHLTKNATVIERKIDVYLLARIDITYLIIFFGVGEEGKEGILNITSNRYKTDFVKASIEFAGLKPKKELTEWGIWKRNNALNNSFEVAKAILNKRKDNSYSSPHLNPIFFSDGEGFNHYPYYSGKYHKYYGGHQFRLGHYFRHFYQTVKFIDSEKLLAYKEKYKYIKIIRGQLSTYEQIIFFLNSLSTLGRVWEIEKRYEAAEAIEPNQQLITKYNLIKNVPYDEIIAEIRLTAFYPDLTYEAFENHNAVAVTRGRSEKYY